MRSHREQAKEFVQRAAECEKYAALEKDQTRQRILRELAFYYHQLAEQSDPYRQGDTLAIGAWQASPDALADQEGSG
jgi:hypothetical protein